MTPVRTVHPGGQSGRNIQFAILNAQVCTQSVLRSNLNIDYCTLYIKYYVFIYHKKRATKRRPSILEHQEKTRVLDRYRSMFL